MTTVRLARLPALVFATLVSSIAPARGQVADHLKCYKLKDPLKLSASADLDSPQFGLDSGCSISKAKFFCVPATKTNVSATNKATNLPIAPLPFSTTQQPGDQICYKVKCPPRITPIADQSATDQFGSRTVSRFKGDLLCVPAVKGASYCGDGTIDPGEQCEPLDLGGNTCASLGFQPGTLWCSPDCTLDTTGCPLYPAPGTCGNGTIEGGESCDAPDLGGATCASVGHPLGGVLGCTALCTYDTSGCMTGFPATGQTTCWDGAGTPVPCAGTGQDGDVRAGEVRSYLHNGDGTITDRNTGLGWEKLSDDGSIHDKDNHYTWPNAFAVKIAALDTPPCFAGHCDWRLPNRRELESIVDLQHFNPCVSPAFNTACAPGCTVFSCSCTALPGYVPFWTSTTVVYQPISAWIIEFGTGGENFGFSKANDSLAVRAVRGGA